MLQEDKREPSEEEEDDRCSQLSSDELMPSDGKTNGASVGEAENKSLAGDNDEQEGSSIDEDSEQAAGNDENISTKRRGPRTTIKAKQLELLKSMSLLFLKQNEENINTCRHELSKT